MKTEEHFLERMTLEQFAEKHELTMEVHERSGNWGAKFYAHFKHAEVKKGVVLIGEFGNGCTPKKAIENYGNLISETLLVIDACADQRREIKVPVII